MTYVYMVINKLNGKRYISYYTERQNIIDSGIFADGFFDSQLPYNISELYDIAGNGSCAINILGNYESESDALERIKQLTLLLCMNI